MHVEDLRGLKIGDPVFVLGHQSHPVSVHLAAFHHHASLGQWHTLNSMVRIAGDSVDGVVDETIAVVEWWRTVESLISLLYAVALIESDQGLRPRLHRLKSAREPKILHRWKAISWWFSEGQRSPPRKTTLLLQELRDFRNSFEHAARGGTVRMAHSRLSTTPASANLADAMEALAICVLICDHVRFVLPACDLMPQVVPPSRHHVLFVPLDEFAVGVAFPAYIRIQEALGLTSEVVPYESSHRLRGQALLEVAPLIKVSPDTADLMASEPVDLWPIFESFVRSRPRLPADNQCGIPRYSLRTVSDS